MSAVICPTITAETADTYSFQLRRVAPFAGRIHIDVADGDFAPHRLIDLDKLWWPANKLVDVHVMFRRPFDHTDLFVAQHPNLVIVHAEAEGNFPLFAQTMHRHGIEVGVALLPETEVRVIAPALEMIDHVLIFSGNLGYQGGSRADPRLLIKAKQLRALKPRLEIGWDGGINQGNARQLAARGVDVLNVGGFIQRAINPQLAYRQLIAATSM
jgi:ribulose-phosphate 3-epimerase